MKPASSPGIRSPPGLHAERRRPDPERTAEFLTTVRQVVGSESDAI
jgi:hypothetical protein